MGWCCYSPDCRHPTPPKAVVSLDRSVIHIAPFNIRVRSSFQAVARHHLFYADYPRCEPGAFIDFDIQVLPGKGFRRWWRPQVRFLLDGAEPFYPLPADQSAPMFEWGLNWCLANGRWVTW